MHIDTFQSFNSLQTMAEATTSFFEVSPMVTEDAGNLDMRYNKRHKATSPGTLLKSEALMSFLSNNSTITGSAILILYSFIGVYICMNSFKLRAAIFSLSCIGGNSYEIDTSSIQARQQTLISCMDFVQLWNFKLLLTAWSQLYIPTSSGSSSWAGASVIEVKRRQYLRLTFHKHFPAIVIRILKNPEQGFFGDLCNSRTQLVHQLY